MGISVIVGTFGTEEWRAMGLATATSLESQSLQPVEILHAHGQDLHEARNAGAAAAKGDWLLFLDADDALDDRFIEHMDAMTTRLTHDYLIRPAITTHERPRPHVLSVRNLEETNFMIIGTLVSKKMFDKVGGFRELDLYEDWDLWLRCRRVGAEYAACRDAVYRIFHNPQGRNSQSVAVQNAAMRRIVQ